MDPLAALSKIGHAFFARDGVRLAFGKRWDGAIIHISQADRGAACGCQCPAKNCGRKLVARKPDSDIAHHFAHAPLTAAERAAGVAPSCEHGNMTALHHYAEQLLNSRKSLVLPPVTATYGARTKTFREAKHFAFDVAKLETMDGETIPDVILEKDGERMQVEVHVTHRCGPEKRAKIATAGISAVEIDLSALSRDTTIAGLDEAILTSAPREWIYNRKAAQLRDELERLAKRDAAAAEKKRLDQIEKLKVVYASARRRALASNWKDSPEVQEIFAAGDGALLDGPSVGEGYFSVHPKVWKAAILGDMLQRYGGLTPFSVIGEFRKRGWITGQFWSSPPGRDSLLADAKLPDRGAEQVVVSFLQFLAAKGVIEDVGWTWKQTQQRADQLHHRRIEQERADREAAELAARLRSLTNLGNSIAFLGSDIERQGFDVASWMEDCPDGGRSLKQIAIEGDAAWRTLKKALATTLAVLKDECEEQAEALGLPVRSAIQAMHAVHEARAAQRKAEEEEAERLKRLERQNAITALSSALVGDAHSNWMDKPHSSLNGMTPRDAAGQSVELLEQATRLVRNFAAELAKKAKWVGELEQEASRLLSRPDMLRLYMTASNPDLPGRVSPSMYTRDVQTMQQCLALLRRRFGKR
jgi:hypothetical protein